VVGDVLDAAAGVEEMEAPTEALRQQFEAMRYTPPVAKRYLVNDTTTHCLNLVDRLRGDRIWLT